MTRAVYQRKHLTEGLWFQKGIESVTTVAGRRGESRRRKGGRSYLGMTWIFETSKLSQ